MMFLSFSVIPTLFSKRDRPFTYVSRTSNQESKDGFYGGNGNFKIAFGLQNSETAEHILDQRIYGARAKYIYRKRDDDEAKSITVTFSAKIKPCDIHYFDEIKNKSLTSASLKNLYCLSEDQAVLPQQYQDMRVHGRFDSVEQGKLLLSIERCREDCKSPDVIEKVLNTANVAVYFTNFAIDLIEYDNPFKKILAGLFTSIDADFSKKHEIFMKRAIVVTDGDLFIKSERNVTYDLMDYQRETVSSSRDGNLYTLVIQMSTVKEEHKKTYKKIFAVIAEIGGYLKAFVLFYYIYKPFLERKYYIELINHLYSIDGGDELKGAHIPERSDSEGVEGRDRLMTWRNFEFFKNKSKKGTKHDPGEEEEEKENENGEITVDLDEDSFDMASSGIEMKRSKTKISLPNSQTSMLLKDRPEEEEDENGDKVKKPILKFKFTDWLGIFLPFLRGRNHNLYMKGRRIIENNTDITILMRKLQEFEMFKRLMLDKHQEKLFSSLPKPNLTNLDIKNLNENVSSYSGTTGSRSSAFRQTQRNGFKDEGNYSFEDVSDSQELHPEEEVIVAYDDLKKRETKNEITSKLLKAFEESVLRSKGILRRQTSVDPRQNKLNQKMNKGQTMKPRTEVFEIEEETEEDDEWTKKRK